MRPDSRSGSTESVVACAGCTVTAVPGAQPGTPGPLLITRPATSWPSTSGSRSTAVPEDPLRQ